MEKKEKIYTKTEQRRTIRKEKEGTKPELNSGKTNGREGGAKIVKDFHDFDSRLSNLIKKRTFSCDGSRKR